MTDQFSFSGIKVGLHRRTRHLEIQLSRYFSESVIFELESILSWAASRVEIDAILLRPEGKSLPHSLATGEWTASTVGEAQAILGRLRQLVVGMFYLPQTIVMDLGEECRDLGAEFCLGADLRVAAQGARLCWNHLQLGRAPCSGGLGILPLVMGDAPARKWLLAGQPIPASELLTCGFLTLAYRDRKPEVYSLLEGLCAQSSVARIQAKRALLQSIMPGLDRASQTEDKIAAAALITEDYRRESGQFCSARDFVQKLQIGQR